MDDILFQFEIYIKFWLFIYLYMVFFMNIILIVYLHTLGNIIIYFEKPFILDINC